MSYADKALKGLIREVLENGTSTEGQKVRPHWEDGTPAHTIKTFGACNTYDLRKEFPAITIRKTGLKSCMDEILWIYQKKSNKVSELNSHIWDQWVGEDGTIGKAYGYQVGQKFGNSDRDQMNQVLYDLKNNPFSRRIMISLWNVNELGDMNLQPCCWSVIFNVTDEGEDKLVLNMILNQRSNDMIVANNWNTAQYAILLMMVAQSVNMIPGKLMHIIADAHIYDRHIDIAKELLERPEHPAPKVSLNPEVTDFYKFTVDDLIIEDYVTEPQIKNIPVAI